MALIPFDPFRNVDHWKRDLDRFFNEGFGMFQEFKSPRVDVYENANEVVASCEIPGLEKKEDVHIHVENNTLMIHGTINKTHEVQEDNLHRKERFSGRFERAVSLPSKVQAEGTTATYKNGILEVRMPKVFNESQKKIDIQFS